MSSDKREEGKPGEIEDSKPTVEENISADDHLTFPGRRSVGTLVQSEYLPAEVLHYIKEKEALNGLLAAKDRQFSQDKSKMYDLNAQIHDLKKQIQDLKKMTKPHTVMVPQQRRPSLNTVPNGKHQLVLPHASTRRGSTSSPVSNTKSMPSTLTVRTEDRDQDHDQASPGEQEPKLEARVHPLVNGMEHLRNDTYKYFEELTKRVPNIKLHTVIEAERKFVNADSDGSGSLDVAELEKVLTTPHTMFTRAQVEAIIKEVDSDNSGTVDFLEALMVMEKLDMNRRAGKLPDSLQRQRSNICSIQ